MTQAAIERYNGNGAALAMPLEFTPDQRQMIRDTYANGASDSEFAVLIEVAKARRLNPLLRQVHFVKRWNRDLNRNVWAAQASIDGLRAIAERTGKYSGQDEPEYVEQDGKIVCCKVRVYRTDWQRPAVGVAYWSEYVQKTKDGETTRFWREMPHVMIAKCAEALALRKAFPEDMSGLYVPEEMAQGDRMDGRETAVNPETGEVYDVRPLITTTGEPIPGHVYGDPPGLMEALKRAAQLADIGDIIGARELVGTMAAPGEIAKQIQIEWEAQNVSPGYHKALGKEWQRLNRLLAKLEKQQETANDAG